MTATQNQDDGLRDNLLELKERLIGAWRTESHASSSGTAEEQAEAHDYSLQLEQEMMMFVRRYIAEVVRLNRLRERQKLQRTAKHMDADW